MIHRGLERLISLTARDGNHTFFPKSDFPWVAAVEASWQDILDELNALMTRPENIPAFQDISPAQARLTQGNDWRTFFLYAYGHTLEDNCSRCPRTVEALAHIPGMKTAMFSILAPGMHIPEHRGPYNGVLRYHLGLIIPEKATCCRIRVDSDVRHWEAGESLIFDDTYLHEVWNESPQQRVVLFVDFERPLPFPISFLNRSMIRHISKTDLVLDVIAGVTNNIKP